jgi:hypothetical protein
MSLCPVHGKTLITKQKEERMGQINTMKTNSKRRNDHCTDQEAFVLRLLSSRDSNMAIAAIQETSWNKLTPQAFTSNGYSIYTSRLANNHEFGTAFLVDSKFNHMVINFTPINERLCVIRIKS